MDAPETVKAEAILQSSEIPQTSEIPHFLEVTCKSSGEVRRFAAGTEAGFALYLINRKLGLGIPPAFHIEAAKVGEEPVSFGPKAVLVNYGEGWKLQTATEAEAGYEETQIGQPSAKRSSKLASGGSQLNFSSLYIGKIFLVFGFIFLLGGVFTVLLENLPRLILFVSQSL